MTPAEFDRSVQQVITTFVAEGEQANIIDAASCSGNGRMGRSDDAASPIYRTRDGRTFTQEQLLPKPFTGAELERREQLSRELMRLHADPLPPHAYSRAKLNALIALSHASDNRDDDARWNFDFDYACQQTRMCLQRLAKQREEAAQAGLRG